MPHPHHDTPATAPGDAATPALNLERVTKRFSKAAAPALDDVSLQVPAGSFTVILGEAGAGKTTTLRVIAGLETPDAGRVLLSGVDVGRWEPRSRNVAMIFDNLALYPNKTGFQNIAHPLLVQGAKRDDVKPRVERMAATLQIPHVLHRLPKTMSGGERQRVALGRALIRNPALFLLDEPLSSLDAKLRIELRAELRRLQREHHHTFLMATPDYNEAMAIADTVALLREGRVVQIARPQDLYDFPVDREAAQFVGSPMINILPARLEGDVIHVGGGVVPLPEHLREPLRRFAGDEAKPFELGVRPENIALTMPERAHDNGMVGALIDIEPLGLKAALTLRNDDAELRVLVESEATQAMALQQPLHATLINAHLLLAFDPESGARLGAEASPAPAPAAA